MYKKIAKDGDNNVYLNEEEKAPIYEAYDKLFDTLQTRETDKGVELYQGVENNAVDLTEEFNEQPTKTDVEKYLEKIIGLPLKTGTPPLQVQVTEDNIPHIIRTNVSLHGSKKREHLKAVNFLEKILSKSVKVGEEPVDLTHNTSQETLDHKKTLEKYIYFEGQVKVGDDFYTVRFATEQVKGQNPNLLDIYNIHIKRGALHNSTDRPSYKNNITQSGERVNSKKVKQGVKGSFTPSKNLIQLFKDADASTLPHEFAHYWLNNMWNYVRSGAASEKYKNRWGIVADWLGIKPTQTRIYRAQQEQFARGYEAYLWRGELPNPIIKGAFDDYDKWLKEVYNDINEFYISFYALLGY